MSKLKFILLAIVIISVTIPAFSQSLDVLILGSTESIESDYTPFDPTEIAAQLNSILIGDSDYSGTTINIQFNDIFRSDSVDVSLGGAGTLNETWIHKRFSLFSYCHYPADNVDNISDLKGELSHDWDYVIIMGDPYMISILPGYYALGVNKVLENIKNGGAEAYLFMQWPDESNATTVDHFEEVTYRIGNGAASNLTVIPAGLAWSSLTSGLNDAASTSNHPSPNGSYLAAATIYSTLFSKDASSSTYTYNDQIANHAHQTVQNEEIEGHYNGVFDFISPFSACNIVTNSIDYLHTGTSTENGFQTGFIDVIQEEQLYSTGSPYDFNYGRANYYYEPAKRYKTDSTLYPYALGFPMQDHPNSGDSSTFYGIDYRQDDIENGTDIGVARYMLNVDEASYLRAIPVRSMTTQLIEEDPSVNIYQDSWHISYDVNRAVGSFMFTLLTGKCGLQDSSESAPSSEIYHTGMSVGYRTAWTMMHLKGKAPGFRVIRTNISDTVINPVELTTLKIRFFNQPTDTVRVLIHSDNESAVNFSSNEFIFTPDNYYDEQSLDITSLPGSIASDRAKIYFNVESNDIFFNDFYDVWEYEVHRDLVSAINYKSVPGNTLRVFPNPSSDQITIVGAKVNTGSILSLDGRVLSQFDSNSVDISNLTTGVYFVKVGQSITKLVKL